MSEIQQRELEIQNAKAQLLQSTDGEQSTYDILAKTIRIMLDERPANPADVLSPIIDRVKRETVVGTNNISGLQTSNEPSNNVKNAEVQKQLFESSGNGENDTPEDDDEGSSPLPDMQELLYYFEQGGIGLGRDEWTKVYFALKKLCDQVSLMECRFWGKILGLEKNYYVAEVQFRDEEEYEENNEENGDNDDNANSESNDGDDEDTADKLPSSSFKPPPKAATEAAGQAGVNKYVYFVCNNLGEEWIRLPSVTPYQIQVSRQITKFFTGNLNAPVVAFPNWEGTEANLLRAQIARISAGTIIAPMTYYQFDDEEEVDDEEIGNTEYIVNPEFEGVSVRDLADPTMQSWVHSRLHILQQGRCIWQNPNNKEDGDIEDDEEEEEGDEENQETEQEIGPPLLTPLSDDVEVGGLPPWSANLSSGLSLIQHAICIIKSNLWPGAFAFSNGHKFENVYIGYGQKFVNENYSPPQPQAFANEYGASPNCEEDHDPTVEEETALKQANEADEGEEGEDEEEDDEE